MLNKITFDTPKLYFSRKLKFSAISLNISYTVKFLSCKKKKQKNTFHSFFQLSGCRSSRYKYCSICQLICQSIQKHALIFSLYDLIPSAPKLKVRDDIFILASKDAKISKLLSYLLYFNFGTVHPHKMVLITLVIIKNSNKC